MMYLSQYEGKIVRVIDVGGRAFTGVPVAFPADYGFHEFNRDEESIKIEDYQLFESDIAEIKELPSFSIIRATETWQQAGAYYVRIQAMAKKHHIALRQEFDEHDGPDTKYIVIIDNDFPIATARMYPLDEKSMMIGRVVVLPEYRRQGIGTMVVSECEVWAEELGYSKAVVESRDNKVAFYEQMLYEVCGEAMDGDTFRCIRMEKDL
jgi:predicted GNAT family N-acyltransferase